MEWHLDKAILDFGLADDYLIVMDWNDGRRSAFDPRPYFTGDSMAALADPSLFKSAYLLGHGRGIGWPGNRDFGVSLLYDESTTMDDSENPLPPRGPRMIWNPERRIKNLRTSADEGILAIQWDDGTTRMFSTWDHATDDSIEKFADPAYFARAHVEPERNAVAWPDDERIDAKTLYERAPIVEADSAPLSSY